MFRINSSLLVTVCVLLLCSLLVQSAVMGAQHRQTAYGKREDRGAGGLAQQRRGLPKLFDLLQRRDFDIPNADERDLAEKAIEEDAYVDVNDRDYLTAIGAAPNPWGRKKRHVD